MALHFHLVNTMADALTDIFEQNKYADKVIEKLFKANRKWGARDRRFFAETVYEIVRHRRKLEHIAQSDEVWSLIGAHLALTTGELPKDWPEFDGMSVAEMKKRAGKIMQPEVLYSFPDWLHELGTHEFGADWPQLMQSLNKPAEVYLRVNRLKTSAEELQKILNEEQIETEVVQAERFKLADALKLKIRKNVFVTKAFKEGLFEVQDAASQLVAPLLGLKPGLRVADACAGAGGKTLHIASLMKNKGKVISMDIHEWKLKELRTRASRGGIDIVETKLIEGNKTIKRLEGSFDRVLLDVPCSGLGVVRRNPDTKWKLSIEEIDRLVNLQQEILTTYSEMCKVGGIMVYATCSILHRENEKQVQRFMESPQGQHWQLLDELRVWPHRDGFDGFYAAVFEKKS